MSLSNLFSFSQTLSAAHSLVTALLRFVGLLFGVIPKAGRLPRSAYVMIHYGFIFFMTALLAWFSTAIIPESRVTWSYWFVRRFYVAIQFVLFYLFVRLLIAGIQLFFARDLSEFEDINHAWESGLDALAREGFDLQWLPVFLINGASPEQQKSLLESARIPWKVSSGNEDSRLEALSFHASDEALFICLNDVGSMSRQIKKAASRIGGAASPRSEAAITATMRPDQLRAAVDQSRHSEPSSGAAGRTLAPGAVAAAVAKAAPPVPQGRLNETMRPGAIASASSHAAAPVAVAQPAVLEKLGKEELLTNSRRLEYFCQLLVAERGAYCPLNGLLQVIPLGWTGSAAHEPLVAAVGRDIQTLHDQLHLQFPVICLHAGLEEVNGLGEFLERGKDLDSRFRDSRAGSRFPGGLSIDEKSASWVVERGLQWFRDWVYAEFAKNLASPKNRQLYQFLCSLSLRRDRLVRELRTAMGELQLQNPVRLTGCYFAATGVDTSRQAFVHGVMQRLMSEQNDVAWQPQWKSRDRRCLWLTGLLFLITAAIVSVNFYLIWRIWELASQASMG